MEEKINKEFKIYVKIWPLITFIGYLIGIYAGTVVEKENGVEIVKEWAGIFGIITVWSIIFLEVLLKVLLNIIFEKLANIKKPSF